MYKHVSNVYFDDDWNIKMTQAYPTCDAYIFGKCTGPSENHQARVGGPVFLSN